MDEKIDRVVKITYPTLILGFILLTIFGIACGVALQSFFGIKDRTFISHYHAESMGYPETNNIVMPEQKIKKGGK